MKSDEIVVINFSRCPMRKSLSPKKKIVCSAILSFLTLFTLLWFVFRNHYKEIFQNIQTASIRGLLWILCMGFVYQLLDSLLCLIFVRRTIRFFSFKQAVEVTLLGVFGNVVTLSVGSIPMQSAYLHRKGMEPGEAAGIMSMEYVLHKSTILLCSSVLLLLEGQKLFRQHRNLLRYVVFGYLICIIIIILLILICTLENFYRFICKGICRLESLSKWADRAIQWKQQVDALHIGARDLLHTPNIILIGVGINAIKLMGLYSIPYLCMRAIGIDYFSLIQIQTLSALAHVISNALPNIAGMGSVEAAFLLLFSCYMDAADVSSVLVLYRLSTYFVPFLLSAFATERIGLRLYTKERSNTSMHTSNQEENHGISLFDKAGFGRITRVSRYTSECTKGCLILKCSAIILFSSTRKETIAASPHNDLQL